MVDVIHDRAELARLQIADLQQPDTADPAQHPYEYPWQSPTDPTGYPYLPWREPDHQLFEYYRFSLAQNISYQVTLDRAPECWLVTNRNITNTNLNIYLAEIASGTRFFDIGPGGKVMLPARGHRVLTIVNVGTGTAIGNVVAMSNKPTVIDLLDISSG